MPQLSPPQTKPRPLLARLLGRDRALTLAALVAAIALAPLRGRDCDCTSASAAIRHFT